MTTFRDRMTDGSGLELFKATPAGIVAWVRTTRPTPAGADVAAYVAGLREAGTLSEADVAEVERLLPELGMVAGGSSESSSAGRVAAAMDRLRAAERSRRAAITELRRLGALRSRGLVADLGEGLAAVYYGVDLAPPSTPGYDLVAKDGRRVQVRTLRSTPTNHRTSMGAMKDPYDTLFAIRLDENYSPTSAIEVPRAVLEDHYPHGTRTSWTARLEKDERVRRISARQL